VESKFRITQNQTSTDHFIYNIDDESITTKLVTKTLTANAIPFSVNQSLENGAWADDTAFHINTQIPKIKFRMDLNQLTISGKHNTYNSMAASVIANSLLIRNEVIRESLMDFKNIEHRLEYVATVKGVDYINDSKATNVNSAWYALESMKKPVIWIAGGIDKGNDYEMLQQLVKNKVKAIVCLGKNNKKLHDAFEGVTQNIVDASSMEEAVKAAYYLARNGDTVLLSPACASFDLFDNYEDRGAQFKKEVRNL